MSLTTTDQIDIMIAMLDIIISTSEVENLVVRELHRELLIDTDERDRLIADTQAWGAARQSKVFAL
jgi:hypothetical protein